MIDSLINLFTGGGGKIVSGIGNVIDNLTTSDEERAQAKQAANELVLREIQTLQQGAIAEMNAKRDVVVAELNQGDLYTKRARPTVVYAGLVMMFINEIVLPWLLVFLTINRVDIPPELQQILNSPPALSAGFYTAWGGITGSWAIGRSVEKVKGQSRLTQIMQGPAEMFQGRK